MSILLVVVDDPCDWLLDIPGVRVVAAREYLSNGDYGADRAVTVFNLCRSYQYQSLGYYVSLLAEARGHRPLPRLNTVGDLQSPSTVRFLTGGLDEVMQHCLGHLKTEVLDLLIYFGRSAEPHFDPLTRELFHLLQAPLLRAHFYRHRGQWYIHGVRPLAASDLPPEHHDLVARAATDYFVGRDLKVRKRSTPSCHLAVLVDPASAEPPSNAGAMAKFERAAAAAGMSLEYLTPADLDRLTEFDALFIRETTNVNHYTYRFSRRAAAEGLVVIDDPDSILKCTNKVYLAELFARHGIPVPRTLLVHRDNVDAVVPTLGLPCVLKAPDSSGSQGVMRIETEESVNARIEELLKKSELIVAQEYLPTDFDWRVGVLDHKPLYACRYYMAPGHWQIIKRDDERKLDEGRTSAVPLDEVPAEVVRTALAAADLIGDGLYGVDLKQTDGHCYVIEVNDNPNIDAGNEDRALGDALYLEIMTVFARRIEARKGGVTR